MKHKKAIKRFRSQGLNESEIKEVISWLTALKMPIEKFSKEIKGHDILMTVRQISKITKAVKEIKGHDILMTVRQISKFPK